MLDLDGEAGELFGIPECCREAFAIHWPRVSKTGGDLFGDVLLRYGVDGNCDVARACDVTAMYRGGGYCWHFPCRPDCRKTIELVGARRAAILQLDPDLARELDEAYRLSILLLPDGRYSEPDHFTGSELRIRFL